MDGSKSSDPKSLEENPEFERTEAKFLSEYPDDEILGGEEAAPEVEEDEEEALLIGLLAEMDEEESTLSIGDAVPTSADADDDEEGEP